MSDELQLGDVLCKARQGDAEALGCLLEAHRPYLRLTARRYLGRQLRGRADESDLIQQTCLSAFRNFPQFAGEGAASFLVWLKQIHERNIQDCLRRHMGVAKRTIRREEHLHDDQLADLAVASSDLSPSRRLLDGEAAVQLAQALERLPEDQQEAVRLRYLDGQPLEAIARELDRSEQAVAGLLKRGMRKLRESLYRAKE